MKTALIAGYSGLIGRQLLSLLLEDHNYQQVVAIGRRILDIQHPKLTQLIVDFNNLQLDMYNIDDVFCCLGTTMKVAGSKEKFRLVDFQYPVNLAAYCLQNGAMRFALVSSLGANKDSKIFYLKVKGEVETAIGNLGFTRLDIYRPSALLGPRNEKRTGEAISKRIMQLFGFILLGPLKNYRAIDSNKVARAMLYYANTQGSGSNVHMSDELQNF
jgi:uncharacterized protein YbjT (DUF2867 family)